MLKSTYQSQIAKTALVIFVLFGAGIVLSRVIAQTSTTTITEAPDAPPVISAFVKSANELHPDTIYAGLHAYISVTITDDKGIASGGFNAPGMKYSSADVNMYGCKDGVKSCREPVYIIVPASPGNYTVTVRATDTAGQTATYPISFTAVGCTTTSECGGTYFPSSGATFCGEQGESTYTKVKKYQVVSVCSAGTCDEKTEPGVLQDCTPSNKICGFDMGGGGTFKCVTDPVVRCTIGAPISYACRCGPASYASWGYCCNDSYQGDYQSSSQCPPPPPPPPPPPAPSPTSTPPPAGVASSSPITPAPGGGSGGGFPTAPPPPASTPVPSWPGTTEPPQPSAISTPEVFLSEPAAAVSSTPIEEKKPVAPLTSREIKAFSRQKRQLLRELKTMERFWKRKQDEERRESIVALRARLDAFAPQDSAAFEVFETIGEAFDEVKEAYDEAIQKEQHFKELKGKIKSLQRYVLRLESKVRQVEKRGIAVQASFKDALAAARDILADIKAAKTVEETEPLEERMEDVEEALNEYLPKLEVLARLPEIIRITAREIADAERLKKEIQKLIRRVDGDFTSEVQDTEAQIARMKNALASLRSGTFGGDDGAEYIDEEVTTPFDIVRGHAERIRAMANLKRYVGALGRAIKQLERRLVLRERGGESMDEARTLLGALKQNDSELRAALGRKLAPRDAGSIMALLRSSEELQDQLEDLLRIVSADAVEAQWKKIFSSIQEQSKRFEF